MCQIAAAAAQKNESKKIAADAKTFSRNDTNYNDTQQNDEVYEIAQIAKLKRKNTQHCDIQQNDSQT